MNPKDKNSADYIVSKLTYLEDKYHDYEFPKVSIVIPTHNCANLIALTLDNVLEQRYPDFEIIIVDAGSTDRTIEVVKGFRNNKIRIYSVSDNQRYQMLNSGISHALGKYVSFLFPGDFYIYSHSIRHMMALALEHESPQMVFCGTLLRDGKSEVKKMYRPLSLKLLKKGHQPTSLQSCWFRTEIIKELGKFNTTYNLRGGFDLMCRFSLKNYRAVSTTRIFTDYDMRWVTWRMVALHFYETLKTIWKHFGFFTTLRWLFVQKDMSRFFNLWKRGLKAAFALTERAKA